MLLRESAVGGDFVHLQPVLVQTFLRKRDNAEGETSSLDLLFVGELAVDLIGKLLLLLIGEVSR